MGKTSRFLQFKCSFPFFRIYSYISIKGERTWTVMDRNIYMHELDNKMCSKGFHNTVSKSDLENSRVYKYIWFRFCDLVLLRTLEINQFEMAQNLRFNLLQQESWITSGGGDSENLSLFKPNFPIGSGASSDLTT